MEENTQNNKTYFGMHNMFSKMTDISLGNLKNSMYMTSVHRKVTREDIIRWMKYPEKYAKELRDASIYLYDSFFHSP